jgi:hypothetical protein
METKLTKFLPWLALAGLILVVGSFVFSSNKREEMLIDSGETTQSAEQTAALIQSIHPEKITDVDFQEQVEALLNEPNIATVWLFDAQGNTVLSEGSTARRKLEGNIEDLAPIDVKRLLETLPKDTLTEQQRGMLLTAAVIRSEGEHNDIYRHKVAEITSSSGKVVGWVGLAYDNNSQIRQQPDITYILGLLLFFAGLVVYWLSLPAWVYLDARGRNERAVVWAVFVLIGNLAALTAYLLVRQPVSRMNNH